MSASGSSLNKSIGASSSSLNFFSLYLSFRDEVYDNGAIFFIVADSVSTTSSFFSSPNTAASSSSDEVTIYSMLANACKSRSVLLKFNFFVY